LDSGGQYLDGTTDITRTVCLGQPSAHQRACFSRVLQGLIALASAVFPHGTSGPVLDILARSSLWRVGLNYNHGTGHGVGAFLNVHEGPHGICSPMRRSAMNEVPLMPGMLVSNEPGYYESGAFGIRIESVMAVQKVSTPHRFGDIDYYGFETIALVPIQAKMLDFDILTRSDRQWLNDFHRKCFEAVSPLLSGACLQWLRDNTREL
jgi:Xaa-Pro aminopeptidase